MPACILGLGLSFFAALRGVVGQTFPTSSQNCTGYELVWEECTGLPNCTQCVPRNCSYSDWSFWSVGTSCNGLCTRSRVVNQNNTECGSPCQDVTTETKSCPLLASCTPNTTNCNVTDWQAWTSCAAPLDQQTRVRALVNPTGNGKACMEVTKETKPCDPNAMAADCKVGDWNLWTACSATCGGGVYTRQRTIQQAAARGGSPCDQSLAEGATCSTGPCPNSVDCIMSNWTDWSGCDCNRPNQRYRQRTIISAPQNGGAACPTSTQEVRGCNDCPTCHAMNCTLKDWTDWSSCPVTCGGGQAFRYRSPITYGGGCGNNPTEEITACNDIPCHNTTADCQLSQWAQWGTCSPACGVGQRARQRTVTKEASLGGQGCTGALDEVEPCSSPACTDVNCQWDAWTVWTGCTATCGGGTQRRQRVISVHPQNNGALCSPGDRNQIQPCNQQTCAGGCIDGAWEDWGQWSTCTTTCDSGFRFRHRGIAKEPNSCGKPVSGPEEDFEVCNSTAKCEQSVDCQLAQWSQWSACSTTCFGIRERSRYVEKFPQGLGKPCQNESLKDVEPCNPSAGQAPPSSCEVLPKRDCVLGEWANWTACPVTCGAGQQTRQRRIAVPSSGGGTCCCGSLSETQSCNTDTCGVTCIDCLWSAWSEWGDCTQCDGQMYRVRRVTQLPNKCGKQCGSQVAKESTQCTKTCGNTNFCAWAEWGAFTGCSVTCGNGTSRRQRQLKVLNAPPANGTYLFKGVGASCSGTQFEKQACGVQACADACQPQDCVFSQWEPWRAPESSGLCQRSRTVQTNNNACGKACNGTLIETMRCNLTDQQPQDCGMSDWGEWGACPSMYSQRYRVRSVKTEPARGGRPCQGPLQETMSCLSDSVRYVDCGFTDWSPWGACSHRCRGQHQRTRHPGNPPASGGGVRCAGPLKELEACSDPSCPYLNQNLKSCQFSAWGDWGACGDGQQSRTRVIAVPAAGDGAPCNGTLDETQACQRTKVDCQMSPWTVWSSCDRTCGSGQSFRHRTVQALPRLGGAPCPTNQGETQACSGQPCAVVNCMLSAWSDWSVCPRTCGIGQSKRNRTVTQQRTAGGIGCNQSLEETVGCNVGTVSTCPPQNCKWGDWVNWGSCTRTCGSGRKVRSRSVAVAAIYGGQPCSAGNRREVAECNTGPCGSSCQDGAWTDWTSWGSCSRTCDGGTTVRTRNATAPNACGAPATGASEQVAGCNQQSCGGTDCGFGTWTNWSACSATCHGIQRRTRQEGNPWGSGNGQRCKGSLMEVTPCNPGQGQSLPSGCSSAAVNCNFTSWSDWSSCTHTCGLGQQQRNRTTLNNFSGAACQGILVETTACNNTPCVNQTSCSWGAWTSWGTCDRCAGTQSRSRTLNAQSGAFCDPGTKSEVKDCGPRTCQQAMWCVWQDWSQWQPCQHTCGRSKRSRQRNLALSTTAPKLLRLYEDARTDEGHAYFPDQFHEKPVTDSDGDEAPAEKRALPPHASTAELAAAFALGCVSLLAGLAACRVCSRSSRGHGRQSEAPASRRRPLPTALFSDEEGQLE